MRSGSAVEGLWCLLAVTVGLAACNTEIPASAWTTFSMAEDSLPFENFTYGYRDSTLDDESLLRMFGAGVCVEGRASPCRLTPVARAWMNTANGTMAGGRCEGFAVLSNLFSTGDVDPVPFGSLDARHLTLRGNSALQREIAYWYATQMLPLVGKATRTFMASDVMPFLAEQMKPEAAERWRIGIVKRSGGQLSGGHALTPIGYQAGTERGVYLLRIYDSNNPDADRVLRIDTIANRWEYEAARDPKTRSSLYYGDASNNNPLYFAPVRNRLGTLPCSFCDGAGVTAAHTTGGLAARFNSAAGPTGVDPTGNYVTADEQGTVAPLLTTDLDGEAAATLVSVAGTGDVRITLSGMEERSQGSVTVYNEDYFVSATGLSIGPGTSDELQIATGAASVRYDNNSGTTLTIDSLVVLADGSTLRTRVSVGGASSGVAVAVDPQSGESTVTTRGTRDARVVVGYTKTEADGSSRSGQLVHQSDGESTLTADTGDWGEDEDLSGEVDDGSGQVTTVTDGCSDGGLSGLETDVDCGGGACAPCELGRRCLEGRDCASTFCHATTGRCVATACEDGALGGDETDVDCGGSCGPCALGEACAKAADCSSGVCAANVCVETFAIGGTLSGLPAGDAVTLQNNGGDDLLLTADGAFSFATEVTGDYLVTVASQPAGATCTVSSGSGTATADVISVQVTCAPVTFSIGGTLSGLPAGDSVTLQNNGGDDLVLTDDGAFSFATEVTGDYLVTVASQPAGATCTVSSGSGTATADVTDVQVTCALVTFSIGGTLGGLPAGESVTLQNNGGDDLVLSADGAFSFATEVTEDYLVTVASQPASASCTVTNGAGTATADVTSVQVTCAPVTFSIGGTLGGLPTGRSVTLRNNGGDDLVLSANGAFTFATEVTGSYLVTVASQPAGAFCTVANGSGTATADVTNVQVSCTPVVVTYSIGGTLSGLPASESVTLRNNGGDDLVLGADGAFAFATRVTGSYLVTVASQPATASCTVSNGSGTATANVTNVQVTCAPVTFFIGGTLGGLPPAESVTLQNNGGDDLVLGADGPFVFATEVIGAYDVTVAVQPPSGTCSVTSGSGVAVADVTDVAVTCEYCGDGTCQAARGEDPCTCEADCGTEPAPTVGTPVTTPLVDYIRVQLAWGAATGACTPQNQLEYRVLFDTDASMVTASVGMDWTANTTTAMVKPATGLVPNTTYFFVVQVRAPSGAISGLIAPYGTVSATTLNAKRIYVTAGLLGNLGGVAGADALCQSDPGKPAGTYKAMLVDGAARRACTTANCGGGAGEHVDWPLAASTTYVSAADIALTTNAVGLFDFPLASGLGTNWEIWTGLTSSWTTSGTTCSSWTSQVGTETGTVGVAGYNDSRFISAYVQWCNYVPSILCVEQ